MTLHYKKHNVRRVVGDMVWDASNNWSHTVGDHALVEILLKEPEFEVVQEPQAVPAAVAPVVPVVSLAKPVEGANEA